MIRQKYLAFVLTAILSGLPAVHAESLIIANIDKSDAALTERPRRGMSMDTVESKWGQPVTKHGRIGDPPISRWDYSAFVVYFEYGNVIHAVNRR